MLGKGKLRLNVEEVNIRNIIEDCFKLLSPQALSKGIKMNFLDEMFFNAQISVAYRLLVCAAIVVIIVSVVRIILL